MTEALPGEVARTHKTGRRTRQPIKLQMIGWYHLDTYRPVDKYRLMGVTFFVSFFSGSASLIRLTDLRLGFGLFVLTRKSPTEVRLDVIKVMLSYVLRSLVQLGRDLIGQLCQAKEYH